MQLVTNARQGARRRTRSPEHDFHIKQDAYTITPFMYHPVRPGETLKNILWQSRAVTDPIANPLMGWHLEYYYFYVQLQDAVTPGTEDAALQYLWDPAVSAVTQWGQLPLRLDNGSAADATAPDITYKLYKRVVEEYFREEGEVWNSAHKMNGNLALARRNRKDVYESWGTGYGAAVDVAINIGEATPNLTVQEILDALQKYYMLLDTSMGAVTTFEDYLASQAQGNFSDPKRAYRPELIRVMKEWSYPVNTVNPADGAPSSAVSWAISGRADKDRYFREPGFIVGVSVARPKTIRPSPDDAANAAFKKFEDWLPVQAMNNPQAGIISRDLFEHGYQFVNWDTAGTYKAGQIQWVDISGTGGTITGCYPVVASINSVIWKTTTSTKLRQDGKVQLNILTDLPKDMIVGAGDGEVQLSDASTVEELAVEYHAKLQEARATGKARLPNVRATLERLAESSRGPGSGLRTP